MVVFLCPQDMRMITLYYVHDPMCSWCWAFRSVWEKLQNQLLHKNISVKMLLGGLAPDNNEVMPSETRAFIMQTWKKIESTIPNISFNFDFWDECEPKRSTYPACRAVIAAKEQGKYYENKMIYAIQRAYYQQARNPSEGNVLRELASEINLDINTFSKQINSDEIRSNLLKQIEFSRKIGGNSFPSLLLKLDDKIWSIKINYTDENDMLNQITKLIKLSGIH